MDYSPWFRSPTTSYEPPFAESSVVWPPQDQKNLSQLPNFAFSVPLAKFHQCLSGTAEASNGVEEEEEEKEEEEADRLLQDALISFPSVCDLCPCGCLVVC